MASTQGHTGTRRRPPPPWCDCLVEIGNPAFQTCYSNVSWLPIAPQSRPASPASPAQPHILPHRHPTPSAPGHSHSSGGHICHTSLPLQMLFPLPGTDPAPLNSCGLPWDLFLGTLPCSPAPPPGLSEGPLLHSPLHASPSRAPTPRCCTGHVPPPRL